MIPSALEQVLRGHGLTWAELRRSSEAVFLFGSRAAACEREDSDWDILCIGDGRSQMRSGLDLLWIPVHRATDTHWFETELASHVAAWGRCLHGDSRWVHDARPGPRAVRLKAQVLQGHIRALPQGRRWSSERHKRQRIETIRRDLQRYSLLMEGLAVPPSALLDERWQDVEERRKINHLARASEWPQLISLWPGP